MPPAQNRDPLPEEIEACASLQAQIRAIRPQVICTLGRFVMNALISPALQISKAHGQPAAKDGILFIPLFHPAVALHQESLKRTLIEDKRTVREILMAKGLW